MITWYARNDVPYSGGEKQLSITFPYIKKEHIKVFVNDVETTEYHFLNESQIFLDCELTTGDIMSVRRNTPIDAQMVTFTDTSILNAEKQNLAQKQVFNTIQEIYDNNQQFNITLQADVDEKVERISEAVEKLEFLEESVEIANNAALAATEQVQEVIQQKEDFLAVGEQLLVDVTAEVDRAAEQVENIDETIANMNARVSFAMFDTVIKDHILTYEESKGLALQGTYVYKDSIAGSRYGYADFYNKCLEEYNDVNTVQRTVGVTSKWVQPTLTENGIMGGDSFACSDNPSTGSIFKAFNIGNTANVPYSTAPAVITFYNPVPICVKRISWAVYDTNRNPIDYTVQGSHDNISYDDIIVNQTALAGSNTLMNLTNNYTYYKYYRITVNTFNTGAGNLRTLVIDADIITDEIQVKANPNRHIYYDIADKVSIDKIYEATGLAWFYGIDTENERIFLPRDKYFAIKGNIPVAGNGMTLGFTNGTQNFGAGSFYGTAGCTKASLYGVPVGTYTPAGVDVTTEKGFGITTDPDYSGIEAHLTANEDKYLYICVGNTEAKSTVTNVVDVTTTENDTLPLFTGQYFDFNPNHLSWLKGGRKARESEYPTCYNELVNELTSPKYGLKVINEADMIIGIDYSEYWKVNQEDMTFTTPTAISLKALDNIAPVAGNGKAVTWTNGTSEGTFSTSHNSNNICHSSATNLNVGDTASHSTWSPDLKAIGVTTDPTKSGIEAHLVENSNTQLYFKVANAVQNLELLNVGKVMENAVLRSSLSTCHVVVETYQNNASWYRIYSDGWCEQGGNFGTAFSSWTAKTVTFLKPFKNLSYFVVPVTGHTTNTDSPTINKKTADSFSCTPYNSTGNANWYACGYIR